MELLHCMLCRVLAALSLVDVLYLCGLGVCHEAVMAWLKSKRLAIDRLLSLEAKQQAPKARSPEAALQRWVPSCLFICCPSLPWAVMATWTITGNCHGSAHSSSLLVSQQDFLLLQSASCSSLKQPESLLSPCHAVFASLPPFFSSTMSLPCLLQALRSKQTSDSRGWGNPAAARSNWDTHWAGV